MIENEIAQMMMDAKTKNISMQEVMGEFLRHLRAQTGWLSLPPKDAVVLHLVRTFGWLPSQVEVLTDRELRLILHTNWQLFLSQQPSDQREGYQYVLGKAATKEEVFWRTIDR